MMEDAMESSRWRIVSCQGWDCFNLNTIILSDGMEVKRILCCSCAGRSR